MNIIIKNETEQYHREVENLTREAFWDLYKPGCDEHLVLHNLRKSPAFIHELDFVAVLDNNIVGNIIYSKATVKDTHNREHEVLSMGPISVLPGLQKKGIGSLLMEYSLARAKDMGFRAVIIFGDPRYYHRFGFRNAREYGITTEKGENFDAFMALELKHHALKDISGSFHFDKAFFVDPDKLEEFEKEFPHKEKHITDTQLD